MYGLWHTSATSNCVTQLMFLGPTAISWLCFFSEDYLEGNFPQHLAISLGMFHTCSSLKQRLVAPGELPIWIFYGLCPSHFSLLKIQISKKKYQIIALKSNLCVLIVRIGIMNNHGNEPKPDKNFQWSYHRE